MLVNNPYLEVIESTKSYKEIETLIAKVLYNQWTDLLLSGIVNSFFIRYKDFFVNRRGIRIKIRKAEGDDPLNQEDDPENDNIRSIEELREEENRTQQRDRLLLPEKILNMSLLLIFLNGLVDKNINTASTYYKLSPELKSYLKAVGNKGGQSVIDSMELTKPLSFRLSKKEYVDKISSRVKTLVKGMDNTTKKMMVNQLVEGIRAGETKSELVKRIEKAGLEISKTRAKRIVLTETQAINEYIRHETARLNGVRFKTWVTADEKACPICKPMDGMTVSINRDFKSDGVSYPYPPAHTSCRCWVDYKMQENSCSDFVKRTKNLSDKIKWIQKAVEGYEFYGEGEDGAIATCVNPNAVWAGGESLVGSDKNIGNIYENMKNISPSFYEDMLFNYQDELSEEGMVQLRLSLGLSPNKST